MNKILQFRVISLAFFHHRITTLFISNTQMLELFPCTISISTFFSQQRAVQKGRKHRGKRRHFLFSHSFFERLVLQRLRNERFFGKGLNHDPLEKIVGKCWLLVFFLLPKCFLLFANILRSWTFENIVGKEQNCG